MKGNSVSRDDRLSPRPDVQQDSELRKALCAEHPFSPMQRGMLFDHLASGTPEVDVLQVVGTLDENLDVVALQRAWDQIVERHSAFRTYFRWEGLDDPVRIVQAEVRVPIELRGEPNAPLDQQQETVQRLMHAERSRGFDLSRPPLARVVLVSFGPSHHVLILTVHHILMDAGSFPLVIRELFAIYDSLGSKENVFLAQVPAVENPAATNAAPDGSAAEMFWCQLLDGFSAPTPLPRGARHEWETGNGFRRGETGTQLPKELTEELRRLASSLDVTLSTLVHTAWGLLLSRYSGEDDVVFGSVRKLQGPGETSMVGLHINTLPTRLRMDDATTLAELLRQVRHQHLAGRSHVQTPLVEIRRCSKIPGPTRLFDTFVVFNRESLDQILQSVDVKWSHRQFRLVESLSSLPLGLYAYADPCLGLKLVYDNSRFDGATAAHILDHLECILTTMPDLTAEPVTHIPMLTPAEIRLLSEWNDTRRREVDPVCVHEVIETRARRNPDTTALISSAGQLTCAELDRWANALAVDLKARGVGPEALVGIYLPRSLEMVVSVLAVLKAGGAYVPLDPDYPKMRLSYMLQDAQVQVVLTDECFAGNLPEGVPHVVCVHREPSDGAEEFKVRPEGGVSPTNLAYVIYTSGSTGNPKGVMVEHRNVVNFFHAMDERIAYVSGDVWLAVTSLSFDISILELLWTLSRGFTVVIYPGAGSIDPTADGGTENVFSLGDYLERYRVTHMQCTPSMALMMTMDDACRSRLRTLQHLLIGGEPFPIDLAAELRRLTAAEIINMYGPTETTIWSSTFPVVSADPKDPDGGSVVPIGWPILNTTFHVLDRRLQPLPPGVAGELFIGGDGVARGYLNQTSLTSERFIPDPFGRDGQARLYRTGDLVRRGSDGCLRFLGRIDNQIKLQGYRIEPGEIEQHLQRHPGIDQAAVVACESTCGDRYLRACLVPASVAQPCAKDLRDYLGTLLPDYMIPSEFLLLERLPLTPNKKLDRKSLAALRPPSATSGEPKTPARDGFESKVAGLWEQVLGLQGIGRDENFFDIGGDSFRAMKLYFKLRTVLGRKLSLTDIFRFPTVRLLCDHLGRQNPTAGVVRSGIDRGRTRRMRRVRRGNSKEEGRS